MKRPTWFVCQTCGVDGVGVDEDELCATCGGDTFTRRIPAGAEHDNIIAARIVISAQAAELTQLKRALLAAKEGT